MQSEGIKRVRNARQSRDLRKRIWKEVKEIAEAIISVLFLVAVGCLIGIGFGIGVAFYAWM